MTVGASRTDDSWRASLRGLLAEQVAVVAGGGRGIGEACVRALAGAGAAVAVVDKVAERAEAVASEVVATGGRALPVVVNLRRDDELASVVDLTLEAFGRIDVLMNVAGGMRATEPWRPGEQWSAESFDFVVRQNLRWVHLLCGLVVPRMVARGAGGSIVSIGSISGVFGAPNHGPYGAAKAGLIHLMRTIAVEHGRHGIRANTVCPGSVTTPAVADVLSPRERERSAITTPLGRMGTASEMADVALFLASPLARYVTGQELLVDGGASVRYPLHTPGAHPSESLT